MTDDFGPETTGGPPPPELEPTPDPGDVPPTEDDKPEG